jgi:hypothetical protein
MRRTIEAETSFFDTRRKRWSYSQDCYVIDLVIDYPPELDDLDDDDLLELVECDDERVKILSGN